MLDEVTDADLEQVRTPAPLWGVDSHTVGAFLAVVLNEHSEDRRCAERDLAVLSTS